MDWRRLAERLLLEIDARKLMESDRIRAIEAECLTRRPGSRRFLVKA